MDEDPPLQKPEFVFFRCLPFAFDAIHAGLNNARGYPSGGTSQALPDADDIARAPNGDFLLAIPFRRVRSEDTAKLAPAISAGMLWTIERSEFLALTKITHPSL